jgi:hypothetical protein
LALLRRRGVDPNRIVRPVHPLDFGILLTGVGTDNVANYKTNVDTGGNALR